MKKITLTLGAAALLASLAIWPTAGLAATTYLCFCKYPNTPTFQGCAGQEGHVSDNPNCAQDCTDRGLTWDGNSYTDYNDGATPVDWVFTGGSCLGPNPAQTSDKAKSAQADWKATGQKAQNTAVSAANTGSVVGLSLPSSDISVPRVIGRLIKGALGIVGSIAFLMFVYAGFSYLIAQGDPKKTHNAIQTMIWAALGLVVIFGAYAIVSSIFTALGGSS